MAGSEYSLVADRACEGEVCMKLQDVAYAHVLLLLQASLRLAYPAFSFPCEKEVGMAQMCRVAIDVLGTVGALFEEAFVAW